MESNARELLIGEVLEHGGGPALVMFGTDECVGEDLEDRFYLRWSGHSLVEVVIGI
jgi:hypothetical protein